MRPQPVRRGERARRSTTGEVVVSRPFEQVNLVLGVNGLVRTDDRRYALGVLNAALGGGTSSRLFQEVREHRGLAYSVYSYAAHYADAGAFAVAVGCLPSKVTEVLSVVRGELGRLADEGITAEELERGKGQLRGGLVLSLEDSASRMARIAKAELLYDELPSLDEVIRRVDEVSLDDVAHPRAQPLRPGRDARRRRAVRRAAALRTPRRLDHPTVSPTTTPAQATAHSTLQNVPMMNRSATPPPVGAPVAEPV